MIFIFGISPKQKVIGPAEERNCPNCNNKRFWLLKKEKQWFSLFFIPTIPLSSKYMLQCPICHATDILSKEEFERMRNIAQLNNDALNGGIDPDQYERTYKDI